jgi:hypothetical protein
MTSTNEKEWRVVLVKGYEGDELIYCRLKCDNMNTADLHLLQSVVNRAVELRQKMCIHTKQVVPNE